MIIPITKPSFDNCERENILKPLESGWIVQGPYVAEFEKLFSSFTGAKFARATTSCTTALHLALDAIAIKRGDRVIIPSFTFVASANAVEYTGAEVVFCDIDLKTFNINVIEIEKILKADRDRRIKAIMVVNLFGLCAGLHEIINLAKEYNLKLIEDSACGLGAYIGNKHSGTFGDVGCFSFHPRKVITTGEGGMLITDNKKMAEKVSFLRDHGASKSDFKRHVEKGGSLLPEFNMKGYNYRMTDLQGSIGVCQMKKAKMLLRKRAKIARKYNNALKNIKQLMIPYIPKGYTHGYQSYVCLFTNGEDLSNLTISKIDRLNIKRNYVMTEMEKKGIMTRQGTHAVHTLGYYKRKYKLKNSDFINSYAADRLSITLPLYADMTGEEFEYVVSNIKEILR